VTELLRSEEGAGLVPAGTTDFIRATLGAEAPWS
jgi:hypothetical protein